MDRRAAAVSVVTPSCAFLKPRLPDASEIDPAGREERVVTVERAATGFCPGMGLLVEPALAITSRKASVFPARVQAGEAEAGQATVLQGLSHTCTCRPT